MGVFPALLKIKFEAEHGHAAVRVNIWFSQGARNNRPFYGHLDGLEGETDDVDNLFLGMCTIDQSP